MVGPPSKDEEIRNRWGICRHPIDLFNMPIVPKKANDAFLYGSLSWFSNIKGHLKHKYDGTYMK